MCVIPRPRFLPTIGFAAISILLLFTALAWGVSSTRSAVASPASQPAPAQSDEITITLWHQLTGQREDALRQIFDEFEAAHPNVTVVLVSKAGYDGIRADVIDALGDPDSLPDLVFGYPGDFAEYARFGLLRFLDDLAAGTLADFYPDTIEVNRLPGFGGRLAGLPVGQSLEVMYYNGDLLATQGAAPPLTWTEFRTVCDGITAATSGSVDCAIVRTDASHLAALVWANGGELLSADERTARFAEPLGRAPVQHFRELLDAGQAHVYAGFPNDPFGAGEVAFTFGSSGGLSFYETSVQNGNVVTDWGIAAVPNDGSHSGVVHYGPNVALLQSTAEEEAAAWQAMQWLTQPDANARLAVATGYFPVRVSAATHPLVLDKKTQSPQYAEAYDLLPSGRYEPAPRGWGYARNVIKNALISIYELGAPVEATLQQAADDVTDALADLAPVSAEVSSAGGSLAYTDSQGDVTTVEVPAGALSITQTVTYIPLEDLSAAGPAFALTPDLEFSLPVLITVHYQDEDIAGMDEDALALYQYDWASDAYVEAAPCGGYVRDAANNTLQAGICHFSDYVVTDAPYRTFTPYMQSD